MTTQPGKQTIHISKVSQKVKAIRQWNLASLKNITQETFFLKNHTQNVVRNYPQNFFRKIKIEQITGSIVQSFMQFVFVVCQDEDYRNVYWN